MLLRPLAFLILLGGCPGPAPDGPTDAADTDTDADTDAEGDGYPAGDDFDDDDAINPGAAESPCDGDDADLLIAAVALSRGATLVTGNRRHYERIPGIVLEDWLRP